jgi:hypothetical protein
MEENMRRRHAVFTLALLAMTAVVLTGSTPAHAADTAVLLSCKGEVTVVRKSGENVPGLFGLALHPGDEVRTGDASAAEILFENDNIISIGAGSSMQIRETNTGGGGNTKVDKSFETVQNFLKLKDADGGTVSVQRLRAHEKSSTDGELVAISPTTRTHAHPKFVWSGGGSDIEVKLTVHGDDGAGIVWEHTATGNSLAYPESAPALEPGHVYFWELVSTDPLQFPPLRADAFFEIIATADAGKLEAALAQVPGDDGRAYHLLRASIYYEFAMIDQAISETELAIASGEEDESLETILARLHAERSQKIGG